MVRWPKIVTVGLRTVLVSAPTFPLVDEDSSCTRAVAAHADLENNFRTVTWYTKYIANLYIATHVCWIKIYTYLNPDKTT